MLCNFSSDCSLSVGDTSWALLNDSVNVLNSEFIFWGSSLTDVVRVTLWTTNDNRECNQHRESAFCHCKKLPRLGDPGETFSGSLKVKHHKFSKDEYQVSHSLYTCCESPAKIQAAHCQGKMLSTSYDALWWVAAIYFKFTYYKPCISFSNSHLASDVSCFMHVNTDCVFLDIGTY